ncbi:hypothetical protein DO73_4505 [Burkholderia pseudomallei]|nr:hypothetical protein DO73_4505 [Burkholderia pseudomallei]
MRLAFDSAVLVGRRCCRHSGGAGGSESPKHRRRFDETVLVQPARDDLKPLRVVVGDRRPFRTYLIGRGGQIQSVTDRQDHIAYCRDILSKCAGADFVVEGVFCEGSNLFFRQRISAALLLVVHGGVLR